MPKVNEKQINFLCILIFKDKSESGILNFINVVVLKYAVDHGFRLKLQLA